MSRIREARDWVDVIVRVIQFIIRWGPWLLLLLGVPMAREAGQTGFRRGRIAAIRECIRGRQLKEAATAEETTWENTSAWLFGVPEVPELEEQDEPPPEPALNISRFDRNNPAPDMGQRAEGCH